MLPLILTACGSMTTGTLVTDSSATEHDTADTAAPTETASDTGADYHTGSPALDDDDALILAVSFPTALDCGQAVEAVVTVRNTGTATWTLDAGYKLGAVGDEDLLLTGDVRVWLDASDQVLSGQEHSFVVPLQAPDGWSGTTTTDWQMVHEGVRWFGDDTAAAVAVTCEEEPESAEPLPLPDMGHVVDEVAAERPDLLADSCLDFGGSNDFLDLVVDRLRGTDDRWGYNWKRGNTGDMSQDVVDYHWGHGTREGSEEVYIIDMIVGHCGDDPQPGWLDVTQSTADSGTLGRWTGNGRF
jgi:hypothetical protein